MDYREKISKLLALAESNNENEAKSALLKARKLMAEHKLSEEDCIRRDAEVERRLSGVRFTHLTNEWIAVLACEIAENYCCAPYVSSRYQGKTYEVGFVGFREDLDVCTEIFHYACDCVMSQIKKMKKELGDFPGAALRKVGNAYGMGFARGLQDAMREQDRVESRDRSEWGLVLRTPKEAYDNLAGINEKSYSFTSARTGEELFAQHQGYTEGMNFNPERRIAAREEA